MNFKPSIPAYIQIKNDIIEKIRNGIWEENQKIPSELKMMDNYKVGRGTIRDAMKLIVDEGYVYIKKGVGTFVSQNEVGISLEPFVSLTYFIKMRGLEIKTEILEQYEFVVDEECSSITGLEIGSKAMYVKRLRILEGYPLAIEEFQFSMIGSETFKDYNFKEAISQFMFDEKKIAVSKMNMDFEMLKPSKEIGDLLRLKDDTRMIKSTRKVFVEPNNEIFYFLTFYCGEKSRHMGTDKFI